MTLLNNWIVNKTYMSFVEFVGDEVISAVNIFYIIWEKKSIFLPYNVKKHHSILEMDTFKNHVASFLLISLRSITNLAHDFKSPFLDIEITITSFGGFSLWKRSKFSNFL